MDEKEFERKIQILIKTITDINAEHNKALKEVQHERDELKKWKSKQIDLIECFNEVDKRFDFKALEKKVLAMRQKNMVSIEDVKKVITEHINEIKKEESPSVYERVIDLMDLLNELDKLKGGE